MRMLLAFVLFSSLRYAATRTSGYVKENECQNGDTCSYGYKAAAQITGGGQINVFANVDLFCESVGAFNGEPSVRSCINIKDAAAQLANDEKDEVVPITKMDKWFCFAQSSMSGRVLEVFHAKEEKDWIVNFKKSIASAFQANYEGKTIVNETDSQSIHTSHYEYSYPAQRSNWQVQERRVDIDDVYAFAGTSSSTDSEEALFFHQEDKIEVDDEKRVQSSVGKTIIEIGSDKLNDAAADGTKEIPALGATTDYKLKLSHCMVTDRIDKVSTILSGNDYMTDDLLAHRDEVKIEKELMSKLYSKLLSLDKTMSKIQVANNAQKRAQLINNWKTLLQLESKYGAPPGAEAKLPLLLSRLQEIKLDEDSIKEREFIYNLLSSEGSLKSQQALLDMLQSPMSSSEINSLLIDIALLPTVHYTTVDSLISHYESLKPNDLVANQLLLSIAALGRHDNIEDKIVSFLSVKQMSARSPEDTSLILHAFGNTASKKMIQYVSPFLSDPLYQAYSIDALRGVSMDDRVEEAFAVVVSESLYPRIVVEVVQSLLFPFKNSLYSSQIKKDLVVLEELKTSLIQAGIKYNDHDLTQSLIKYFTTIKDAEAIERLRQGLESKATRRKRSYTSDWDSNANSVYNLVESQAQRKRDVDSYPYHKGYLWGVQIGYSKIHADIAAGGFGGVGIPGFKLYARARFDLVVWSKSYTALDIIFKYLRVFPDSNSVSTLTIKRYAKVVGYTLVNYEATTQKEYKFTRSYQKSLLVFKAKYSFFIYVGHLDLYIEGDIVGHMKFEAFIARLDDDKNMKASAQVETGPTFTVKGGATANVLEVFKIGMDVPASIIYTITPEASTSVCEAKPKGDANACFEVFQTIKGVISVEAWWQRRKLSCSWHWGPRCSFHWKDKSRFGPLSHTWNLVTNRKRLFGLCSICDCGGKYFLNVLCKGPNTGASSCKCRIEYSFGK